MINSVLRTTVRTFRSPVDVELPEFILVLKITPNNLLTKYV